MQICGDQVLVMTLLDEMVELLKCDCWLLKIEQNSVYLSRQVFLTPCAYDYELPGCQRYDESMIPQRCLHYK